MISAFCYHNSVCIVDKDGTITPSGPIEYSGYFKYDSSRPRNGLPEYSPGMTSYVKEGDYFKVLWKNWDTRRAWLDVHGNEEHYECDVAAIRRWITDHDIEIDRPNRSYIDIETDSRVPIQYAKDGQARILSWAIVTETGKQYSSIIRSDDDNEEYRLLSEMWEVLEETNTQQLCAWNGDGFDFPVLEFRRRKYNIFPMRARYMLYMDHLECFKRGNIHAAETGEEKRSYKLENICQAILGYGKSDIDGSKSYEYWQKDPKALQEYNINDTKLLFDLEKKKPYLDLYYALAKVCHVLPNSHSLKPTVYSDGYLLKWAKRRGIKLPSKKENPMRKFSGAYVMTPQKAGILENVRATDWKGMYPSLMRSFNMSPDTKCKDPECVRPHATVPITGIKFHTDKEGMIPAALREIGEIRIKYQLDKDKYLLGTPEYSHASTMADACKTALNSIFGITGSPYSRFYDEDVAESTSQGGVWLNKDVVIPEMQKRGWFVNYSDTDSAHCLGVTHEELLNFVDWINKEHAPSLLKGLGCLINTTKLNYDKVYHRIIFPLNDGKAVKKRYVGWYSKPGETETAVEIKGIEIRRGDSLRLATKMQEECIEILKTATVPEDTILFVERWKEQILNDELNVEDITQTKSISRPLEEYRAKNAPHVRMAQRILDESGGVDLVGKIGYIVTDADAPPSEIIKPEEYEGESDRRYLWNKKIFAPTSRLLQGAFPEIEWKQFLIKKTKKVAKEQMKLPGM